MPRTSKSQRFHAKTRELQSNAVFFHVLVRIVKSNLESAANAFKHACPVNDVTTFCHVERNFMMHQ
ncbi:uncharacterized protein PHALS_14930 [Plasmopara halstedii]|uniref:Uncharacterized protein n=1 Tax=Plasmopara halstedii TaxID=4781 RepID=A0A0P1A8N9_PLAHL|nr:uncharacterized protein PHALS_14930 [Plasmopara halstedii]CEG36714.1 hypothetical protein PHALS_14930 [Plasmopara halstedii]|eukprot:XP_024573083.1 hypothetical protein PHALS_14930 [Plasmopara halstedii]